MTLTNPVSGGDGLSESALRPRWLSISVVPLLPSLYAQPSTFGLIRCIFFVSLLGVPLTLYLQIPNVPLTFLMSRTWLETRFKLNS